MCADREVELSSGAQAIELVNGVRDGDHEVARRLEGAADGIALLRARIEVEDAKRWGHPSFPGVAARIALRITATSMASWTRAPATGGSRPAAANPIAMMERPMPT